MQVNLTAAKGGAVEVKLKATRSNLTSTWKQLGGAAHHYSNSTLMSHVAVTHC